MAEFITYREYGAVGDGKTNDSAAIVAAHEAANAAGLPVRATAGDTYYIGRDRATAHILTDTDWTGASIIIDDSDVPPEERFTAIFSVDSTLPAIDLAARGVTTLREGQKGLLSVGCDCFVTVQDESTRNYFREGLNQDNGHTLTDCFILRKNGLVDESTPIIWDFGQISSIKAMPIPEKTLTLRGGTFTHIANQAESKYTYYATHIRIARSNVLIDGVTHYVTGELDHGAPYSGFLSIHGCAEITVRDCLFTAHKTYSTIGSAGKPVSMGTYDLSCGSAANLTFENCSQTTDIMDRAYWGLIGSNYCKNLVLTNCRFSRFDAHMGVTNAHIKGCTLGHQCLNAIGHGLFVIEDSTLFGGSFINLRSDYGSTWKGDMIIKNCTWLPAFRNGSASFLGGYFHGGHDFGYECYMPQKLVIDGLTVDDSAMADDPDYQGVYLLGNITPGNVDADFTYTYPYHITKFVEVKNFRAASGKKWHLSSNPWMYRDTVVSE
ncbi:MAG: hypothetical protein J6C52_00105 [Clostridia bacterium]|nr:hypothetical protein [Clostridia bacterium]